MGFLRFTQGCAHLIFAGIFVLFFLLSGGAIAQDSAPTEPLPESPAPPVEVQTPAEEDMPVNEPASEKPSTPVEEPATVEPVDLFPEDLITAEITVVGTKLSQTGGSAHIISEEELERFKYDDPHAVLLKVPGVYVRSEDGLGLRPNIGLRGVNPDRSKKVTLLEDGIPVSPAVYSAPAAYYFPLMQRIHGVRVFKGPGAIAYGPQTVAGAIDLMTRPIPTRPTGMFDLAAGEYGYLKGHGFAGFSDGKWGALIEGVHIGTSGFKELPNNADTGFVRNEWMFKGSYVVDPNAKIRNEFKLKLVYSDEVSNETYLGLSDADFKANPNQRYAASALDRMKNHRTSVVFSHVLTPTDKLSVTTSVYRNDFSRIWRKVNSLRGADLFDVLTNGNTPQNQVYIDVLRGAADSSSSGEAIFVGPNDRVFVSQGVQSVLRLDADTGPFAHRIESGLRLHYDSINRRQNQDAFEMVGGSLFPEGSATVETSFNKAWTTAVAFHATDAITWKKLTVTPGLRMETMQLALKDRAANTTDKRWVTAVLPGVGAYYAITDTFGALAGVYRGFSPPAPGSSKTTKPEYTVNYETGVRYTKGPMRAEVIGFYNAYSNLTNVCTISTGCVDTNLDRQFDAGKARIYGVEAFAAHDIPVGKTLQIPLNIAYTLTKTELLNTFQSDDPIFGNVQKGDELPYVPRHQLSLTGGLESQRAGGFLTATYVARMREQASHGSIDQVLATDTQFWMDATAWVRPWKFVKLYLNVRNILNSQFIVSRRPFGARPNAPRWVQVGAQVDF